MASSIIYGDGPICLHAQPTAVSGLHPFRMLPTETTPQNMGGAHRTSSGSHHRSGYSSLFNMCCAHHSPYLSRIYGSQIGLRHYEPTIGLFPYQYTKSYAKDCRDTLIYFNPSTDILYLSSQCTLLLQFDLALCRFQGATLAVDHVTFCRYVHSLSYDSGQVMFWDKSRWAFPEASESYSSK